MMIIDDYTHDQEMQIIENKFIDYPWSEKVFSCNSTELRKSESIDA